MKADRCCMWICRRTVLQLLKSLQVCCMPPMHCSVQTDPGRLKFSMVGDDDWGDHTLRAPVTSASASAAATSSSSKASRCALYWAADAEPLLRLQEPQESSATTRLLMAACTCHRTCARISCRYLQLSS